MADSSNKALETNYDAIIIGAGMGGAALGCALAQLGMKLLLIDSVKQPHYTHTTAPQVRVSALNLASLNILKNLNVYQHLEETRYCPFSTMEIWEESKHISPLIDAIPFVSNFKRPLNHTIFNCADIKQPALGYIVENDVLRYCLHKELTSFENVTLLNETKIDDFKASGHFDEKQLCLNNGRSVSSHLVIGVDGAQSYTRKRAGIGVTKKDYRQSVLSIVAEVSSTFDCTWQAFIKTGPMALLPMPPCDNKNYVCIIWYHQTDEIKRLADLSNEALQSEITATFPEKLPAIIKIHDHQWFPLARQSAHKYIQNGIVLIGDAAHTINPLAGQGFNLGLMDVAELFDAIASPWRKNKTYWSDEALAIFEKKCKRRNKKMACIMDLFHYGFNNDILLFKLLRNAGLSIADKLGPVTRYIERYGAGLTGKLPSLAHGFYHYEPKYKKFWKKAMF